MKKVLIFPILLFMLFVNTIFAYHDVSDVISCAEPSIVSVMRDERSGGTGFYTHGLIVTNAHVVGNSSNAIVIRDSLVIAGDVVAVDYDADLALIDIPVGFPELKISSTINHHAGEPVVMIGYPFLLNYPPSVTSGIISAIREMDGILYVQSDVSANEGNSGSPLLDMNCNVVGVMHAKVVNSEGFGLAVSSDNLEQFLGAYFGAER